MRGGTRMREVDTPEGGPAGHRVEPADGVALARWFAERWSGLAAGPDRPMSPFGRADERLVRAAARARGRYPGAVGELVRREILAYRDFGQRFDGTGFIDRVVAEVLSEQPPS